MISCEILFISKILRKISFIHSFRKLILYCNISLIHLFKKLILQSLRNYQIASFVLFEIMTEIISCITSKKNWESKIDDIEITKKWRSELKDSGNDKYLDIVLDLLKLYKNKKSKKYNNNDSYDWIIKLDVYPKDLNIGDCDCDCPICSEEEYRVYNEGDIIDSDSEDDDYICITDIECSCEGLFKKKVNKFLKKFTRTEKNVIDEETKKTFKKEVKKLVDNIPVDYHPQSKNQVIDIVHPSLFCYVKGVTITEKKIDKNILLQWLPAELTVSKKDDVVETSFDTYINNLPMDKYPLLYKSIADIFSKFVDPFESVLKTLYKEKRTAKYKNLSKCQVIVKLANIELTPDSPIYEGGSWHLEGLPTENIIATGIYYYEIDNITESTLNFRTTMPNIYQLTYPLVK